MLGIQLALLWAQGALLNRQQAELAAMRLEIRRLTIAVDAALLPNEAPGAPAFPASSRSSRPWAAKAMFSEDGGAGREMEKSKESAREAVKKARDAQEKISISENARKAEEKASAEQEKKKWTRWLGAALLLAAIAFAGNAWRNRKK
jgi:lipoate-protein ligase A